MLNSIILLTIAFANSPLQDHDKNYDHDPLIVKSYFWISQMENKIPATLCNPEGEFVACYQISEGQCLKEVKSFARDCLKGLTLPNEIQAHLAGEFWGYKVGQCIGKNFSIKHNQSRSTTSECQILQPENEN